MVENPAYHLIAAAVLAESGLAEDAAQEKDWLMAHARDLVDNIGTWTALRYARPEDRERFMGSLRKAGCRCRRPHSLLPPSANNALVKTDRLPPAADHTDERHRGSPPFS